MKRREFLNVAAMGAAGIATAGVTAQGQVASGQEDHAAESWQTDDGIRIHDFESELMKAFYASGRFGQYCHIHPETHTVMVRFATEDPGPNQPNWTQIIPNALSELVKAL
jgi:CubicO group peptidase (beta-lactamase class C family)